jgi:glycolate oxidase FAD binding subunit
MDSGVSSKIATLPDAFLGGVREIVSPEHVRPAVANDSIAGVQPLLFVEPGSEQELASTLKLASEAGLAVIPRGGGTKQSWGNPPARADLILSTARLNCLVEHVWADLTVTVEAGCTIQKLQAKLAEHRQRLALDPLWPAQATVGGVLSVNDSGALRLRFGALRDLIIGVTLILPDGTVAQSGGKVVKNVAGYDLPKLATGAFGTLGIVTRAIFRLHPLPRHSQTLTVTAVNIQEGQQIILAIQDSKLAHTALQGRFAAGAPQEIDVLFEGTEAGLAAQCAEIRKLVPLAPIREAKDISWNARQELLVPPHAGVCDPSGSESAIAKISVLPASLAETIELISRISNEQQIRWNSVIQATGIGWCRFDGKLDDLFSALKSLREMLERNGGSLMLVQRPASMDLLDAWGNPGDALPLMRTLKQQLDPRRTLNPGRYVGGI